MDFVILLIFAGFMAAGVVIGLPVGYWIGRRETLALFMEEE